jgi:hypothetical protein
LNPRVSLPEQPWSAPNGHFSLKAANGNKAQPGMFYKHSLISFWFKLMAGAAGMFKGEVR